MKTAGIIAEFNPFHNGHKYLIDTVRQEILFKGDFLLFLTNLFAVKLQ